MLYFCPTCKVRARVAQNQRHVIEQYVFSICPECGTPVVLRKEGETGRPTYHQVYPVLPSGAPKGMPERVRSSYAEALECHLAGTWHATAVMVRRTLEAITREVDPTAKSLFEGIKSMHSSGAIGKDLVDWAHELRFIGNVGAHATDRSVTAEDAADAVEFLNAIVEILYHLRPKFEELRSRREGAGP